MFWQLLLRHHTISHLKKRILVQNRSGAELSRKIDQDGNEEVVVTVSSIKDTYRDNT